MKDMDNIMKKYVSSFSADKEKDLQKLRSVSVPPKSYSYLLKAACILLSVCAVMLIIILTPNTSVTPDTQKPILTLSDISTEAIKEKPPVSSGGNLEIMGPQKYDVESYMYDERFSEFIKGVPTPKLKIQSAKVDVLCYREAQIGVRVKVDNFLILPGVTAVDAYYIDKDYIISDFEEFKELNSITEYMEYEIFYEIKDTSCLIFFEGEDVYCFASVELMSVTSDKNLEISKILDIIFK